MGASKYIKQTSADIKGGTVNNTILVGNFNTLLTSVGKSSKQKINKLLVLKQPIRPNGFNRQI